MRFRSAQNHPPNSHISIQLTLAQASACAHVTRNSLPVTKTMQAELTILGLSLIITGIIIISILSVDFARRRKP